jgi:Flp pilus assembly protein TadB
MLRKGKPRLAGFRQHMLMLSKTSSADRGTADPNDGHGMSRSRSRRRTFAIALGTLAVIGLSLVHLSVLMSILAVVVIAVIGRGAIEVVERRRIDRTK